MEAVSADNTTQDEPNAGPIPPALPTLVGVNFPEDPIKLLSVQVEVLYFHLIYILLDCDDL